jgi:hypothetical protein
VHRVRACGLQDQLAYVGRLARPYLPEHLQQTIVVERVAPFAFEGGIGMKVTVALASSLRDARSASAAVPMARPL